MFSTFVVFFYSVALVGVTVFGAVQLSLLAHYWFRPKPAPLPLRQPFPFVTVQLPIYNEQYVAARLIDTVAGFDYPRDSFEIQVLDDSTDETVDIIATQVSKWQQLGLQISHICRPNRVGFKAGALAHGLKQAKGEYIVIFDADFLPEAHFLQKTLGYFANPKVGVVQTRWEHINESYSLLTQLQALALDAHFTVEQAGRNAAGHFINFNGTGGVWRKSCIEDAGGWSADTLTEDLDLSYRAQLKGWQFVYLEDVATPAELPVTMPALKSQQYRWAKGGTECMKKNTGSLLRATDVSWATKLQGVGHLWSSSVFVWSFLLALTSLPMLWVFKDKSLGGFWLYFIKLGSFSLVSIVLVCLTSALKRGSMRSVFLKIPLFLATILGLSLHNSTAVISGWLGQKSAFVRTPKWGIQTSKDQWQRKKYLPKSLHFITFVELGLSLCFGVAVLLGIWWQVYNLLAFHTLLAFGFGFVGYYSVKHSL
jgi:cellulose synthase/poly-beta-1,6-N-acetylglucosamine synthase-like glycosyltransferase